MGRAVGGRRDIRTSRPKLVVNDPTLRSPTVEADLGHRAIGVAQQRGGALHPARQEVLVRRLAERPAELAAEVRRRQAGGARERRRRRAARGSGRRRGPSRGAGAGGAGATGVSVIAREYRDARHVGDPFPIEIDAEISRRFPSFRVLVIRVDDLVNGASDEQQRSGSSERPSMRARARFGDRPASSHPHVQAWREAYGTLGSKPSRYFPIGREPAPRGPARRRASDREPGRGRLQRDQHRARPAGRRRGLAPAAPPLRLGLARGGEPFSGIDGQSEPVDAGEAIWHDAAGVTCRRWNWRRECAPA